MIMAKEKKPVNLSLDIDVYKKIESYGEGSGMTAGVLNLLNRYEQTMKLSRSELRGKFTKNEWIALADSFNGTLIDDYTRYSVDMFMAHCEDAEMYESTFSRHEVEIKDFLKKCDTLTTAQLVALYDRISEFWDNSSKIDIEKWAEY